MLFLILLIVLDITGLIMLAFSGKDNISKLKWALAILLLPFVGFLYFLFTGYHRHFQQSPHLSYRQINNGEYAERLDAAYAEISASSLPHKELILYNIREGDSLPQLAVAVDTFTDGRQKFSALAHDMENARHHIHVLYYIFENDQIGAGIAEILCRKAEQGVEVKLLYDPWGNRTEVDELFERLRSSGAQVLPYAPVAGRDLLRFNYRNHRKIVVIDGVIGYTGGMNVSKNYADMGKITPWRDTHIRLTGEAAHSLQLRFFMDWAYASHEAYRYDSRYYPEPEIKGDIPVQIVACGPDKPQEPVRNGFLRIIDAAQKSLCIATGYFVPDKALFEAIGRAAQRGVDTRLLLSSVSDHYPLYAAAATYLPELIKAGVKVYYYQGYVHSKVILADEEIVNIGTANLDIRSFFANFELTAIIYDRQVAAENYAAFHNDLDNSRLLSLAEVMNRPIKDKLVGRFMRLLAPLL